MLFTSAVLMLSVVCRFSREEIDLFLEVGSYDFDQMRRLNELRRSCLAREAIAERFRELQDSNRTDEERGSANVEQTDVA